MYHCDWVEIFHVRILAHPFSPKLNLNFLNIESIEYENDSGTEATSNLDATGTLFLDMKMQGKGSKNIAASYTGKKINSFLKNVNECKSSQQ